MWCQSDDTRRHIFSELGAGQARSACRPIPPVNCIESRRQRRAAQYVAATAGELSLIVSTSDSDPFARSDSYGYDLHDTATAWVRHGRARADMATTLAHELAHAVTHDACAEMPRDVCEVVAESVAYAVCSRFGLDLSLWSVDYVAGWGHPQGHDPEAFRVGMTIIHDGAASLIDAIEVAMTDTAAHELAA